MGCAGHSLRSIEGGAKFHGSQFTAKGQETLAVRYTYLQLGSPITCIREIRHQPRLPADEELIGEAMGYDEACCTEQHH